MIAQQCTKCVIFWMINFQKSTRASKIIIIFRMTKEKNYWRNKNYKLKIMLINKKNLLRIFMIMNKKNIVLQKIKLNFMMEN